MAITAEKIQSLLADLENDCVERTISTTDTDKFAKAICAFANDLPDNNCPGYLIIGAWDNGDVYPIHVTDDLLKNVSAIRTDGNIQPQPSMNVQKVSLPEGDVVVAEVYPSQFPPVKYKGRVWIRVGPRKGIANVMVIEHISLSSNEGIRGSEEKSEEKLTEMEYKVFNLIKENPAVTYAYITDKASGSDLCIYYRQSGCRRNFCV